MRTFVLILLMMAVPLAGGTFQPVKESDYWNNVSGTKDQEFINRFLSNEICWRDIELDLACRRGIRSTQALLIKSGLPEPEVEALMIPPIDPDTGRSDYNQLLQAFARLGSRVPLPMVWGVMASGVISHFDSHARLAPSKLINDVFVQSSNDFRGVGIEVEVTQAGVFVRRVLPASPAAAAGIRVNDQILAVNGHSLAGFGKKIYDTWQTYRAAFADRVTYKIARLAEPLTLRFGMLSSPMVEARVLQTRRGHPSGRRRIGVVTIRNFNDGICEAVEKKVNELLAQKIEGLFLDVRGNVGGVIVEGVCVTSLFLGSKQILTRRGLPVLIPSDFKMGLQPELAPSLMTDKERLQPSFPSTLPVIVLQNSQTASASEILAAGLQDYSRAWIVGEQSHGKGSSQLIKSLLPGLRVAYTVAENFRGTGESLQIAGVTPNFAVPFFLGEERSYLREINLHPTTFRPLLMAQWKETRPREKGAIETCMTPRIINASRVIVRRELGYEDYQMATAMAVFACEPEAFAQHKR